MKSLAHTSANTSAAIRRLVAVAPLDGDAIALLHAASEKARLAPARRDMTANIREARGPVLILDGWAHRSSLLADGRRQIVEFLLPGDIVTDDPLATGPSLTATALTPVSFCTLPADAMMTRPDLAHALRIGAAIQEGSLRRQIVRLGRMDAIERVTDWMLELYDRLELAGLCAGETMPLPLTQEIMADALGLTSVHINRMLAMLRRDGLLNVQSGRATFLNRNRCRAMVEQR